jgi:tetratricopeptide (TPR) repeat protein
VELGAIHLAISKISINPRQPLQIVIHNGVSQIFLKAKTIKEKAEWVNALEESQTEAIKQENKMNEKPITENIEKLNEALATNIFNKFDPLYQKIGKVWSTQAQFEEVMSVMEPELKKSPKLKENSEKLLGLTNQLKESVAEVLYDLEIARKEFAKAINKFSEIDDGLDFQNDSLSEDDLQSQGTIRSVRIQPKTRVSGEFVIEEEKEVFDEDEEEKIETVKKNSSTIRKVDVRELNEDYVTRPQLPAFKDHTKKFSIWGLIRDNIGQDLTRVTLPIILNEPVTMLQKC